MKTCTLKNRRTLVLALVLGTGLTAGLSAQEPFAYQPGIYPSTTGPYGYEHNGVSQPLVPLGQPVATNYQTAAPELNSVPVDPATGDAASTALVEATASNESTSETSADDESDAEAEDSADTIKKLEERIKELEGNYEDLDGSVGKLLKGNYAYSGTSASTMKISGRVHADAWGFGDDNGVPGGPGFEGEDPQNRLGFRRLRFGVAGNVKDNMEYKIEMEFANGSDVAFKDAYLGWNELAFFQTVLLGNQKRPYGLDHINSSRYNVFLERPFVIEAHNQDARRLGLASYGVSEDERFNWRYGVWNMQDVQTLGNYIGDPLQLELAGRLANTLWYDEVSDGRGYAHWAVSGSTAYPSDDAIATNQARFRTRPEARSTNRWIDTGAIADANNYQLLGLESVLNLGAIQIVGEYQASRVNRVAGRDDLNFDGKYLYVAYFLTGEHIPWERDSGQLGRVKPFENFWLVNRCCGDVAGGWGAWQIAARYSQADFSDDDIFGGIGESMTYGMNWHWSPNARMQFNYIDGRIDNRTAALLDGRYNIYGARFMIDF